MPNYFVDTSALAKLYHKETGSEYVNRIVHEPGSSSTISRLSLIEMESVLAIKMRTGELDKPQAEIARRRLRADLRQRRLLLGPAIQAANYRNARILIVKYGVMEGLRTLDALQLAIALELKQEGRITVFVASDHKLCRVAALAGCPAVNPDKPGAMQV